MMRLSVVISLSFCALYTAALPPSINEEGSRRKAFRGNTFVHSNFAQGPVFQFRPAAPVVPLKPIGCIRGGKIPEGQERFWIPPRNIQADVPVNVPATIAFHNNNRRLRFRRDRPNILVQVRNTQLRQSSPNVVRVQYNAKVHFQQALSQAHVVFDPETTTVKPAVSVSQALNMVDFKQIVDICFLVDLSETTSPFMPLVRKNIQNVLSYVSTDSMIRRWRVGFVGYRDFEDVPNQFNILNFTRDSGELQLFLNGIRATGGGLSPNDVFGGISKALQLDWHNEDRTSLLFHMTNSPAHGCDMHMLKSDDFPMGDPEARTEDSLFRRMKGKNIEYIFGRISNSTDVMLERFTAAKGSPIFTFDMDAATD